MQDDARSVLARHSSTRRADHVEGQQPTLPSEDEAPPPPYRGGLWVALAVLAAVVVAIVIVVIIQPFGPIGDIGSASPSSTASPSASVSESPSVTPDSTLEPTAEPTSVPTPDAHAELLAHIDASIRDTCSASSWEIGEPVAQVECMTDGMDLIAYLQFASAEEMRQAYEERVFADEGEGDCRNGVVPDEHGWSLVEYRNRELGRYSCFFDEGRAWMVWTTTYANMVSLGYREVSRGESAVREFRELWDGWARPQVRPLRGVRP